MTGLHFLVQYLLFYIPNAGEGNHPVARELGAIVLVHQTIQQSHIWLIGFPMPLSLSLLIHPLDGTYHRIGAMEDLRWEQEIDSNCCRHHRIPSTQLLTLTTHRSLEPRL